MTIPEGASLTISVGASLICNGTGAINETAIKIQGSDGNISAEEIKADVFITSIMCQMQFVLRIQMIEFIFF